MLECVVNVSEGRQHRVIEELAAAAGDALLDTHHDADHNRSVFTLAGPADHVQSAVRALAAAAVASIDMSHHIGAHPRLGVVDVVPFVPLEGDDLDGDDLDTALTQRQSFATWMAGELGVPCFLYGPERSLPEIRRRAWDASDAGFVPDIGPDSPHPTAGACCVGVRPVLVAYNLWLATADLELARRVARAIRGPAVRSLGLSVGATAQVSCNLIDPHAVGPGAVFDAVAALAPIARAELVGLVPASVLAAEPPERWVELDLDAGRTIEARLQR